MDSDAIIRHFGEDTTFLLPCRKGDHLAWVRGTGFMNDPASGVSILDFWELKAGDRVTITNRHEDLPEWFELSVDEFRGRVAHERLPTREPDDSLEVTQEAPNVWRVMSGDKLAWIGQPRPDYPSLDGVLMVFDCSAHCLV